MSTRLGGPVPSATTSSCVPCQHQASAVAVPTARCTCVSGLHEAPPMPCLAPAAPGTAPGPCTSGRHAGSEEVLGGYLPHCTHDAFLSAFLPGLETAPHGRQGSREQKGGVARVATWLPELSTALGLPRCGTLVGGQSGQVGAGNQGPPASGHRSAGGRASMHGRYHRVLNSGGTGRAGPAGALTSVPTLCLPLKLGSQRIWPLCFSRHSLLSTNSQVPPQPCFQNIP